MTPPSDRKELAEFERRVEYEATTGCWLWSGTRTLSGYGQFRVDGQSRAAHRVSYVLFRGEIPPGQVVCHRCDTPACVNPEHLWLGTTRENNRDRDNKGRQKTSFGKGFKAYPVGMRHGSSKLTEKQVLAIRARRGERSDDLAREFGVHSTNITGIWRRKTWRHI